MDGIAKRYAKQKKKAEKVMGIQADIVLQMKCFDPRQISHFES